MTKLHQEATVIQLASELKLDWHDPINAIIEFCKKRIGRWIRAAGGVRTIDQLEQLVSKKLRLVFEEVWTDEDLERIIREYVKLGEPVFVKLRTDFDDHTYATLLERYNIDGNAPDRYVAVIDCRRHKAARRFFTRWHEIAHLLTMSRQLRLPFHRSDHCDPLERVMDVVAGEIGFYDPLFRPVLLKELRRNKCRLSFAMVDRVRSMVCPEASFQATLSACIKRTSTPVVYLEAGMGLKKHEEVQLRSKQRSMFARPRPKRKLRALTVVPNDAAREVGLRIDRNMQIPKGSVAYFEDLVKGTIDVASERSGIENLSRWTHSDGSSLRNIDAYIEARRVVDRIIAIVRPISHV